MKKFWYIIPAIVLTAVSCTSTSYTGASNDDLYYRPSEEQVTASAATVQAASTDPSYYDNIFAADTLIADEYNPDSEYLAYNTGSEAAVVNNYYGSSAAERIYLFNDSFYPYWQDPYYYSPFSLSLSFGFGFGFGYGGYYGYPYGYYPYYSDWYSPYYYPYYG